MSYGVFRERGGHSSIVCTQRYFVREKAIAAEAQVSKTVGGKKFLIGRYSPR
jgi:hypothetical protein